MTSEEKKYDPKEIERLFFQMDNLLHARVNHLLLAETIFFVAGVTVWKDFPLFFSLCIISIAVTILFTIANLKLYWRVTWLIEQMKLHSVLYTDYIAIAGIKHPKHRWGLVTLWLMNFITSDSSHKKQPRWLDTGWLYTWGLGLIFITSWIVLTFLSAHFGNHCAKL